jgi:hypothetical protein
MERSIKHRCAENSDFICDELKERFVQLVMHFTAATVLNNLSLQSAIADCTLMNGLHADSASECSINSALQCNKPFVVAHNIPPFVHCC